MKDDFLGWEERPQSILLPRLLLTELTLLADEDVWDWSCLWIKDGSWWTFFVVVISYRGFIIDPLDSRVSLCEVIFERFFKNTYEDYISNETSLLSSLSSSFEFLPSYFLLPTSILNSSESKSSLPIDWPPALFWAGILKTPELSRKLKPRHC